MVQPWGSFSPYHFVVYMEPDVRKGPALDHFPRKGGPGCCQPRRPRPPEGKRDAARERRGCPPGGRVWTCFRSQFHESPYGIRHLLVLPKLWLQPGCLLYSGRGAYLVTCASRKVSVLVHQTKSRYSKPGCLMLLREGHKSRSSLVAVGPDYVALLLSSQSTSPARLRQQLEQRHKQRLTWTLDTSMIKHVGEIGFHFGVFFNRLALTCQFVGRTLASIAPIEAPRALFAFGSFRPRTSDARGPAHVRHVSSPVYIGRSPPANMPRPTCCRLRVFLFANRIELGCYMSSDPMP